MVEEWCPPGFPINTMSCGNTVAGTRLDSLPGLLQLLSISTFLLSAWVPAASPRRPRGTTASSRVRGVEPERTADDGSHEKDEPIGLNRAYLVGNRDAHA